MQRLVLLLSLFLFSTSLHAQETTATLNGTINDAKGIPIAGASIMIKHMPTGYIVHTQTNEKGIFSVPNLKPGGPYTIATSFVGFKEETLNDVNLSLGNNPDINISLTSTNNELKEVTVMASSKRGVGTGLTVGTRQLNTLPTIGRSLSDFTRLTPQSNNNSFAGTNFRYNNITLDGAVNNDAIGFSNSAGV